MRLAVIRYCLLLLTVFSVTELRAQSEYYSIRGVNDNYGFSATQTPENLVSQNPDLSGTTFQWQQSDKPVTGFVNISGATNSALTFSAPLTGTTYLRRVATRGGQSFMSNTIRLNLVSVNHENINYIRSHTVLVPGQTTWQAVDQLPIGSKLQTTTYLDNLGRQVEKISKGTATPADPDNPGSLWGDVVQFNMYDAYGRQSNRYLPYTTTSQAGKFKTAAASEQPSYYLANYNETNAYNLFTFNSSPVNRVTHVRPTGTVWSTTAGHDMGYELNESADNVRNFSIAATAGSMPVDLGAYAANELTRVISTD